MKITDHKTNLEAEQEFIESQNIQKGHDERWRMMEGIAASGTEVSRAPFQHIFVNHDTVVQLRRRNITIDISSAFDEMGVWQGARNKADAYVHYIGKRGVPSGYVVFVGNETDKGGRDSVFRRDNRTQAITVIGVNPHSDKGRSPGVVEIAALQEARDITDTYCTYASFWRCLLRRHAIKHLLKPLRQSWSVLGAISKQLTYSWIRMLP